MSVVRRGPMRWWWASVAVVIACAAQPVQRAPAPATPPSVAQGPPPFRVPRPDPIPPAVQLDDTARPLTYRAHLTALEASFVGSIDIDIELARATDIVWIHGDGLRITSAAAIDANGATTPLDARSIQRFDTQLRFLALMSTQPLAAGRYTLRLAYTARATDRGVSDDLVEDWYAIPDLAEGAFREIVEKRSYLFTMNEPMGARRIFPCFDEPRFKVPWQLSIDVGPGDVALSNGPVASTTTVGSRTRYEFATTPPLPSYLIAFAVGPFDLVDAGTTRHGVPLRVAVRKGRGADAEWTKKFLAPMLAAIEDYTAVPFPYPKLDILAVPATGEGWTAMENAGLIAMREATLRADGTAGETPQDLLAILTHELAHHWFGNLVTPAWWNDVWLNEGFAVWMTAKLVARYDHPLPELTLVAPPRPHEERSRRWRSCCARTARPLPTQITSAQTLLPYMSGWASVGFIEELERILGEERFAAVLRDYLRAHAHGTVTATDLARPIGAVLGLTLDGVFAARLDLPPSIPTLTMKLQCSPSMVPVLAIERPQTDPVLACFAYDSRGGRTDRCVVVDARHREIALDGSCPRWLLPNTHRMAYEAPIETIDAVLEVAWPKLTSSEKMTVVESTRERSAMRMASALRLVDERDEGARQLAAESLLEMLRYVPESVRTAFDRKLRAKAAAGSGRGSQALALLAREPRASQAARAQFTRVTTDTHPLKEYRWAAVFGTDPALAGRAIEQLHELQTAGEQFRLVGLALAAAPTFIGVLAVHQAALDDRATHALAAKRCDPRDHATSVELLDDDARGTAELSECAMLRPSIEAAVKAWLAAP